MKLDVFGCEDWLNVYETKATYDIAQSTMSSLTIDEFLDICQIDKEEFLATKPKDQDPIIGNMSIYTKKHKQYWIISHQDLGISFGFTIGEDWPWGYMKVKEISPNNFGKACNYFLENPFNPTKYKSS